jgi:hypothetical protein
MTISERPMPLVVFGAEYGARFARRFSGRGDTVTIQFYDAVSRTGIVVDRSLVN